MTSQHDAPTSARKKTVAKQSIAKIALPLMASWVLFDQLTKWLVVEKLDSATAYPVLGNWFRLYLIRNPGAAFSLGTSSTIILALLQLAATILCIVLAFRVRARFLAWPIALIGGGAAGNLIDRLLREPGGLKGHVVDFLSFWDFAIFNVADMGITIGVALYMFYAFFIEPKRERENEPRREETDK